MGRDTEHVGMLCRFSDSAFLLLPWEPKTVTFTSGANYTLASLQASMSVMSIADTKPGAQNTKPLDTPPMEDYSISTLDWVQVRPFLEPPPTLRMPEFPYHASASHVKLSAKNACLLRLASLPAVCTRSLGLDPITRAAGLCIRSIAPCC